MRSHFPLLESAQPNLLRNIFPYTRPPLIEIDDVNIPVRIPEKIWLTDTTFRDGQQARPPYTVKQTAEIFKFLHRISGPNGVIRQSEFFAYSDKDRAAINACQELDYEFPEITTWIRATKSDIELIKKLGIHETGILTSVSDYHIFLKLQSDRKTILDKYLGIIKDILSMGIVPRCHFEDITRADMYGFVLPYAEEIKKLSEEAKVPIKIRLCDTMGYGIPFVASSLPRSVPKLLYLFHDVLGFPSEQLEWHGHNDFHLVMANSLACWLYGGSSVNCTLLGFGERTGNTPLEGLIINYTSITGNMNGIDTHAITEMADYFEKELDVRIPENYPFVGDKFNVTRAGIHADGVIKNEEIYNIFDTQRVLDRPLGVIIADKAGAAGIALWINKQYRLSGDRQIDKRHPGIGKINDVINKEYDNGRMTGYSDKELEKLVKKYVPEAIQSEYDRIKRKVDKDVLTLVEQAVENSVMKSFERNAMKEWLTAFMEDNKFIQLILLTDDKGKKVLEVYKVQDTAKYKNLTKDNFSDTDWFSGPLNNGKSFITDFYKSKYTDELCITVSAPIVDNRDKIKGVLSFDVQFEEVAKLE
jgi:citrate (Re)-synthase